MPRLAQPRRYDAHALSGWRTCRKIMVAVLADPSTVDTSGSRRYFQLFTQRSPVGRAEQQPLRREPAFTKDLNSLVGPDAIGTSAIHDDLTMRQVARRPFVCKLVNRDRSCTWDVAGLVFFFWPNVE